ncbi:MAG: carboxymuconolactone decarboxylase family protein [Flavobacterium sp.]|uniref:carboxymuconolactone decarboxylase family protein n=1 Tax=Flavobacterium sp. TaxID=239 RepID=UPI003267A85C
MSTRVNLLQTQPEALKAMMGLEKYIASTALDPIHKELIKIRASQINGCAYCIDMHTKDAKKLGLTEQRIYLLNAWKEVKNLYTEEEKAILAMTEEITLIQNHLSDATYNKAIQLFDENYVSEIMMMIITINAWNRIAISTEMQPV